MEAHFQIFLVLLAVLAGTALIARRANLAPAILMMLAGIALAFVPTMPAFALPPELVLPAFVAVIFFIALLISYPWYVLSIGTVLYLLCLPLGYKSYRDQARAMEAAAPSGGEVSSPPSAPTLANLAEPPHDDDRPGRLH